MGVFNVMKKLTDCQLRILEQETINCIDFVGCLGDYQDNDLPESLKLRFDEHLSQCKCCQSFEASYRQVVEVASSIKNEIPKGVQSRLRKALNERLGLDLPTV